MIKKTKPSHAACACGAAAVQLRFGSGGPARSRRDGFSLLELMIAIVILGLGLVMVATTYPIGWQRAVRLADYTRQISVIEAAHTSAWALLHVDDETSASQVGSFAGDVIFGSPTSVPLFKPDNRVHFLYLENALVDDPRAFYPNRADPKISEDWSPWELERMLPVGGKPNLPNGFFLRAFGGAQIRFEARLHPPLPVRQEVDTEGVFIGDDDHWDESFDNVRFAWAVFHKIVEPRYSDLGASATLDDYRALAAGERTIQMYYVALRRGRPASRFARQKPGDTTPNPLARSLEVAPEALPSEMDVLLPSPWRVQVRFPTDLAPKNDLALQTGIPTEIEVMTGPGGSAPFVIDIFQDDTQFIDEVSGEIYRTTRLRLAGADSDKAFLMLDREYFIEDLDDGDGEFAGDNLVNPTEEALRAVWVFPPAVEIARGDADMPIFSGNQPVVTIQKRLLKISPRQ